MSVAEDRVDHPAGPYGSVEFSLPDDLSSYRATVNEAAGDEAAPGWRCAIRSVSAGLVRVLPSAADQRRRDLISRVRTPVIGRQHRVVVLSLKGGVGKTTVTAALGSTLASLRDDRIVAVDANPGRGTLSDKVTLETAATICDLIAERGHIRGHADLRAFTSRTPSGLEILASGTDPAVSAELGADDYAAICQLLEGHYPICLTDCGTGLLHSAMAAVLRLADQVVLASTPAVDSARSADATLDWLIAHEYPDLARDAVMVLSAVRPRSRSTVSLDLLDEHFAARCRAVATIPYDVRLDEGAEVELDQLSGKTTDAFLELAALVADRFATPRRPRRRAGAASRQ
jgi:MinD-like ATPase involved in chromosome partitioning or flagellar assembly